MVTSYRRCLFAAVGILFVLPCLASAVGAQDYRSALAREPEGWKEITPNEKLEGWTRLPVPSTGALGRPQWRVDPRTKHLVCDGDGGHDWLRYDRELGDFIYHIEWRYEPVAGREGYNSGVYVRNSPDGAVWHQAQVGGAFGGYLFGQTRAGDQLTRFNLGKELKSQRVKPAGEWNTYEITCKGSSISVWVNDAVQQEWSDCGALRGYLGVEGEGWKIEFRNLKLKEL
ncbi:MAG: 3-keto-disaccharide hydrolase [Actinomycetota bacterium]